MPGRKWLVADHFVTYLCCSVDDGMERASKVSPLGMVYRKLQQPKTNATGVFVRRSLSQASALSVWQVIPHTMASAAPIEWDSLVRLRHAVTGQYLAIRPVLEGEDSEAIRASTRVIAMADDEKSPSKPRGVGAMSMGQHTNVAASATAVHLRQSSLFEPKSVSPNAGRGLTDDDFDEGRVAVVVATVDNPLDPACLFRVSCTSVMEASACPKQKGLKDD